MLRTEKEEETDFSCLQSQRWSRAVSRRDECWISRRVSETSPAVPMARLT